MPPLVTSPCPRSSSPLRASVSDAILAALHRHLVPFFLLMSLLLCTAARGAEPPELKGIDAYAERALKAWGVPGLAIVVVKDGHILHQRGYGVRSAETGEPVTLATLFAIGSATKSMTATMAGMLVDRGELSWDSRFADLLPGFQLSDPWVTREITVRDALAHRTGLARGDLMWLANANESPAATIARMRHLTLEKPFRYGFQYNNLPFMLTGEAVAGKAGRPWPDALRTMIFEPLGMRASKALTTEIEPGSDVATPYEMRGGRLVAVPRRAFLNMAAAGSVYSNIEDMARWLLFNLDGGAVGGRQLVARQILDAMWTPQVPLTGGGLPPIEENSGLGSYGLGWFLTDLKGMKQVWHLGEIDGMRAQVSFIPSRRIGYVILTNRRDHVLNEALGRYVYGRLLGEPAQDWSARYLEAGRAFYANRRADPARSRAEGTKTSLPLVSYAGTYRNGAFGEVQVAAEGNALRLRLSGIVEARLSHWHHDVFAAEWNEALLNNLGLFGDRVTFRLDANGAVESFVLGNDEFKRAADQPGNRR